MDAAGDADPDAGEAVARYKHTYCSLTTIEKRKKKMSSLVEYATTELTEAGLFNKDSVYNGMLGDSVLEIVEIFAKQGHSGYSAELTVQILEKLLRYKPINPITFTPDQWNEINISSDGVITHQHRKKSTIFSDDNLKTWYDLDEWEKNKNGEKILHTIEES